MSPEADENHRGPSLGVEFQKEFLSALVEHNLLARELLASTLVSQQVIEDMTAELETFRIACQDLRENSMTSTGKLTLRDFVEAVAAAAEDIEKSQGQDSAGDARA